MFYVFLLFCKGNIQFFHLPPQRCLADAQGIGGLLAVTACSLQGLTDAGGPRVRPRLRNNRCSGQSRGCVGQFPQLGAQEYLVHTAARGQQHRALTHAVQLIQITGPIVLLQKFTCGSASERTLSA